MPPVGFEPTISAGERPQTYALDRAATGTGICPPTKLIRDAFLVPSHPVYFYIFLSVFNVEKKKEREVVQMTKLPAIQLESSGYMCFQS